MNGIYETMLNQHNLDNEYARQNAHYEVMQQVILGGLYRGGFFEKAAFYGGTCLRIFHGLKRYSEDMDFSLLKKESDFSLDNYFLSIISNHTQKYKHTLTQSILAIETTKARKLKI